MKILHIINDLDPGGSEKILLKIVSTNSHNHSIISLKKGGILKKDFESLNIECHEVDIINFFNFIPSILLFFKILKKINPDLVQTWLYKSDLLGGLFCYLSGYKNIIWNIRNNKALLIRTKIIIFILSKLSYFIPKKIILCSNSALITHKEYGYDFKKFHLIYNGYSIYQFKKKNNLNNKELILANISRFNKVKNHLFLLKLIKNIKFNTNLNVKLLLFGKGLENNNQKIKSIIKKYNINDKVILKGYCQNIFSKYNYIDLHLLSSFSESFPNVVAETMMNEIPNISIDAGDARNIINDTGWTCNEYNINTFTDAIKSAYNEKISNPIKWNSRKKNCRKRIMNNFSFTKMINKYDDLWRGILFKNSFIFLPNLYDENVKLDFSELSVVITSIGDKKLFKNIEILNSLENKPKKIIVSLPYFLASKINNSKYDNVRYIYNKKYDQISQRLSAFHQVKTKYVLQLDEDTFIYPFHLAVMLYSLKKMDDINSIIAPIFFNILNYKPIHKHNYLYFNFLNNFILSLFFGAKWGNKKEGTVSKSGINFGIGPSLSKSLKTVDWVPGGCLLQHTENLNYETIYNYNGKAYCEDLINSYLFKKKNIKMYVDPKAYSFTDKAKMPFSNEEFYKFITLFKYYNKLYENNNKFYFNLYLIILNLRKFIKI